VFATGTGTAVACQKKTTTDQVANSCHRNNTNNKKLIINGVVHSQYEYSHLKDKLKNLGSRIDIRSMPAMAAGIRSTTSNCAP